MRGAEVLAPQEPSDEVGAQRRSRRRRDNLPPRSKQHLLEHRLPESQPRIVIGRPPSATRYGKQFLRSAAPPYVPPASRRMSGSHELLLTGSTSNSPHGWSNDATTQQPNDLAIQLKGHLRTSFEPSAPQEPGVASLCCSPAVNRQLPTDNWRVPSTLTAEYRHRRRARRGSSDLAKHLRSVEDPRNEVEGAA